MRHFLIVTNPASGSRKGPSIAEKAKSALAEAGMDCTVVHTEKAASLQDLVIGKDLDPITDLMVVGGDGTLNAAINAFGGRWPLSIVPAGTGNDFVKNLHIGKTLEEQFHTAVSGPTQTIDVGACNGRLFLNGVGIGFDGQVVKEMLDQRKWMKGHLAYYAVVIKILAGYRERRIQGSWDGEDFDDKVFLMTIGNGTTFGGGFRLTPNAELNDGLLDVCMIRKISSWKRFANIHRLSQGTHLKLHEISEHRTTSLRIEGDERVAAHIDGDFLGAPPFDISVQPGAAQVRILRRR